MLTAFAVVDAAGLFLDASDVADSVVTENGVDSISVIVASVASVPVEDDEFNLSMLGLRGEEKSSDFILVMCSAETFAVVDAVPVSCEPNSRVT